MKIIKWIAWRIITEIVHDKRTLAFLLFVPVVVMTLIFYAVSKDETVQIGVITRGAARLFDADMTLALESEDNVEVVSLDIPDEETNPEIIEQHIYNQLRSGHAHSIMYLDEQLLVDRFSGKRGNLQMYLEGSHPTLTAAALGAMSSAMDDLASSLPVVIDSSCSSLCVNSVNSLPMELQEHYLYGSDDYRLIDFFLPVFPPFFIFFFTFILSTVSFQRERVRGTLERLLTAPVNFFQIVLGYVGGFFVFATVQVVVILAYVLFLISFAISWEQVFSLAVITLLMMLIGLMMGLLASFMAHNEFQAIQFIPLVVLPQIFLSDMIWDINSFPLLFQLLSYPLPLTHANSAMRSVLLKNMSLIDIWPLLVILLSFIIVIMLALLAAGKSSSAYQDK